MTAGRALSAKARMVAAAAIVVAAIVAVAAYKNAPVAPADVAGPDELPSAQAGAPTGEWALAVESVDLDALRATGRPVLVDFGSDECVPCKEMAPELEEANAAFEGRAYVKFVDVWANPDAASGLPIQVIPTQLLFDAEGAPYVPSESVVEGLGIELVYYEDREGSHAYTAHQGGLTSEQMAALLADMGA